MAKVSRSALPLMFLLSGCTMTLFSKGHTHVEYNSSSSKLVMTQAVKGGQYALYIDNDPIPSVVQILKKGDKFGFEASDEGRVRAVAGNYSTILPRATPAARWIPVPKSKS